MQQLEIEVKFYAPNPAEIKAAILKLGAKSLGRAFENNLRFENETRRLANSGAMLRLRQTQGRNIITVKQRTAHADAATCKVFKEYETEVGDFETALAIFEILGYTPYQVYEKYRETLILDNVKFCIDEAPYGNFIEIEAGAAQIEHYAGILGLNWDKRITLSYLEIFDILRDKASLPFSALTFANFASLKPQITLKDVLPALYAKTDSR